MKIATSKIRKWLIISVAIVAGIFLLAIIFISPIAKYLIEKYDEQITGRRITLDWAYVNPFTGYFHLHNLKIYEYKSDSIFISISGLNANVGLLQLLIKRELEIGDINVSQPNIIITQSKHNFNFDDLIIQFSPKDKSNKKTKPFHFYFKNVNISEGHFYYVDEIIPVRFSIKNVKIKSDKGWQWNEDWIAAKISFLSETGKGGMKGNYSMNLLNLNYHIDVLVNHFDTKVIEQYLKEIANYGTLNANIDVDLIANGCYRDAENINLKGRLAINEFHFGKKINDDYLSFDKVVINMNDVNPKMKKYFIDSVILIHPYFKFEQYDKSNNLATMFGVNASNVSSAKKDAIQFNLIFMIGEYIKKLSKNFLHSDFKVNKLGIYKCDLRYNDYSLSEKFSIELNPLFIYADSVYKNHNRINLFLKSGINPFGYSTVALSINPNDTADFDLQYHLQKLPVALFNPYIIKYTSFPLNRGTIELKGNWQVRNGNIKSDNHLVILDPRISKRIRNKDNRWLPLPLLMYFVRERGNVIDYEIPITGNLRNPKFHLRDVVFDILGNIFIKPPTIPYRIEVKSVETEIEKSISLNWEIGAKTLANNEEKFILKLAKYLKENPEAIISVQPQYYATKETEHLLLFEAKKKYFLFTKHKSLLNFTNDDSFIVTKMSIKDSVFVQYLNKHSNDSLLFSVQEKCNQIITANFINAEFQALNKVRMKYFLDYFKQCNVAKQIKMLSSVNLIPYNGQSIYKMNYNGKFPDDLSKALQQLNQLNDEMPRMKFKKERIKNQNAL